MTRVAVLRAGYGALAVSFLALAASAWAGSLLLAALLVGFLAGVLLAFSGDELPKWAGIALVAYFLLIGVAFVLATPITIRRGEGFGFEPLNMRLASDVLYYLGLASPLMLAGTALAAAWERESPARLCLLGAVGGFLVVGLLTVLLRPDGTDAADVARAAAQGNLLLVLGAVSAASGAVGAAWSAARPEEFA